VSLPLSRHRRPGRPATMQFTDAQFVAICNDASRLTDTTTAPSAGPYGGTKSTSSKSTREQSSRPESRQKLTRTNSSRTRSPKHIQGANDGKYREEDSINSAVDPATGSGVDETARSRPGNSHNPNNPSSSKRQCRVTIGYARTNDENCGHTPQQIAPRSPLEVSTTRRP
jgi:hypothetical protein